MEKRKNVVIAEEEHYANEMGLNVSTMKLKRKYIVDVAMYADQQFVGDLVFVPNVLIKYLTSSELRIFTIILGQLKDHATSIIRRKSIAAELGVSQVTVSNAMASLESMGIVIQKKHGNRKYKNINFEVIQVLNDLLKDKEPGAARMLRSRMGDRNIMKINEELKAELEIKYRIKEGEELEEYD